MKLIDKDALVAEIGRRIVEYKEMKIDSSYYEGVVASLEFFRDEFINTIEVKEVGLEKEVNKYICDNFFGSETTGFFANRTEEEPNDRDMALCAKHFFELGMQVSNKAQKGE